MKLLVFTNLYPNAEQPHHGVFVENRLRHLRALGDIEACVVAPVPWFPFRNAWFGRYSEFARIPAAEQRFGISVVHPRYMVLPKIGMNVGPALLYWAVRGLIDDIRRAGYEFDLIDAHYLFPDAVAAAILGQALGKPVVITARGSDVNLIAEYPTPRRLIVQASRQAAAVIGVSAALGRRMVEIGIDPAKIHVLRNGVDLSAFVPEPRDPARNSLGLTRPTLIVVGNLLFSKGQDIAIRGLTHLPDWELLLVGSGPDEGAFRRLAEEQGVEGRVRFVGRVPHHELARYYVAADISLLPSKREGWPNVLLESMACGTPVVASNVGGVPEIIAAREAGLILGERTPAALADAVSTLFADLPSRAATRAYAEGFSWDATSRAQKRLFQLILDGAPVAQLQA